MDLGALIERHGWHVIAELAVLAVAAVFTVVYLSALLRGKIRAGSCPSCGRVVSRADVRCPRCGTLFEIARQGVRGGVAGPRVARRRGVRPAHPPERRGERPSVRDAPPPVLQLAAGRMRTAARRIDPQTVTPSRRDRTTTRRRRRMTAAVVALGAFLFVACGQDLPQNTFEPAGPNADLQKNLFFLAFWIAVVIFVLVEGLIVLAAIRFRARRGEEGPVQVHGNTRLEIVWTVIPALLLLFIGVPTIRGIFTLAAQPQGDVLNVNVIAHQWWWEFQYPDQEIVTANELHIPVGRPVRLSMESKDIPGGQEKFGLTPANAVIHSLWVPKLSGTQDIIPGRVTHLTLQAERPGTYFGQCKEFCGISHANMRLRVIAQSAGDFGRWLTEQRAKAAEPPAGSDAAEGAELFKQFPGGSCLACHGIDPSQGDTVAPNLAHFGSRTTFGAGLFPNDAEHLERWLRDPGRMKAGVPEGAKMPNYNLSPDHIRALVAYLQSLK